MKYLNAFVLILLVSGCTSLILKPGNFAWPIESVLIVDEKGTISDERYSFSLNVKNLLFTETGDSVNVAGIQLRVIRDVDGYYFITAKDFKNVYVFEQAKGGLKLTKKIYVSEKGLVTPALNQRAPSIELLDADNKMEILLSKDGIIR